MGNHTPKISVIVPVYNVEQYLPRCIDSILTQTFTDFEVLLIDDGSTDSSGKICDEYAEKDERIRVFHKENGGVSSARNLGLDNAIGEWICFSDSDDTMRNNYLQVMLSIEEKTNVDMIVCSILRKKYSDRILTLQDFVYEKTQFGNLLCNLRKVGLLGVPWNKLFKAEIIKNNNLQFDINLDSYEDEIFNLQYLQYAKTVVTSSAVVYNYVIRSNDSLSQRYIEINKHFKLAVTIFQLGWALSQDRASQKEMKINYMRHYADCIAWQYSKIKKMPRSQRLATITKVKQDIPKEYKPYFLIACRQARIYFQNKYLMDVSMIMLVWLKKLLRRI